MKIGLLAYHSACNFGANLQLLSTIRYLINRDLNPVVINWVPNDLEEHYKGITPKDQVAEHFKFRDTYFSETKLCRTEIQVAQVIVEENIEAIIVGSDAVAQHHPLLSRIVFPSRKVVSVRKFTSDRMYPNPFWASFNRHLEHPVPVAVLSASSQDSAYKFIDRKIRKQMTGTISGYKYFSVRDVWTQNMIKYVTDGKVVPDITPDPVFAFNQNLKCDIPSKEVIMKKYGLPENYLLLSFLDSETVTETWLRQFEELGEKSGYECVALPFPYGMCFDNDLKHQISIPLSPMDWYALIKYSNGYIGHNMHPIVVSLHNAVPFFSFDNYGSVTCRFFRDPSTSKIYHILSEAGFLDNRVSCIDRKYKQPDPECVFKKIESFDFGKAQLFSDSYYSKYENMMTDICDSIK